jgi:hypothetical protein
MFLNIKNVRKNKCFMAFLVMSIRIIKGIKIDLMINKVTIYTPKAVLTHELFYSTGKK